MSLTTQMGVEYLFSELPIQIAIDTRPVIGLANAVNPVKININVAFRYVFGKNDPVKD